MKGHIFFGMSLNLGLSTISSRLNSGRAPWAGVTRRCRCPVLTVHLQVVHPPTVGETGFVHLIEVVKEGEYLIILLWGNTVRLFRYLTHQQTNPFFTAFEIQHPVFRQHLAWTAASPPWTATPHSRSHCPPNAHHKENCFAHLVAFELTLFIKGKGGEGKGEMERGGGKGGKQIEEGKEKQF